MEFFRIIRKTCSIACYSLIDKVICRLPVYYKSINKISLYNYWQIRENKYQFLYKFSGINYIPGFFFQASLNLTFQLDNLDLEVLRNKKQIAIMESMYARTKKGIYKFESGQLQKQVEKRIIENSLKKECTLNEFIDYIELTFESIGMIDPYKMSAGRVFSLHNKAVEKNQRLEKLYSKK